MATETFNSFFTHLKYRFQDCQLHNELEVPTETFLNACSEIVPFFDVLGSTAFAPVKSDITGNITKLRQKYATDVGKFMTLQSMVISEVDAQTHMAKNSATDALLWLIRALRFIRHFLAEIVAGEQDLVVCSKKAYELSLKQYHGWMVQGVFSLAMKAVPCRHDFLSQLAGSLANASPAEYEPTLLQQIREQVTHLDRVLTPLSQFYTDHQLDSPQKV